MKNAKVLSALGLMSLASTAALAASGPTLGSVLDASGVKVSGNVAASFRQNANNAQNNFQVDQALLSIAYQPKEGYGAVVDVASGDYNGQGGSVGNPSSGVKLSQAFLQYKSGALTVQGGRFYTAAGYEVFPVTGNLFVSRSLTFGQESTYHTGLRANYAVSDSLSVVAGVNDGLFDNAAALNAMGTNAGLDNGTDVPATTGHATGLDNQDSVTKNKTLELGVNWALTSDLSLALTGYTGKTQDGSSVASGRKQSLYSLVASYNVTKDLAVAVNADVVNTGVNNTDADKATNIAVYATYAVSDKVKAGLRVEELNPKGSGNNTGAVAAVVSYAAAKNFDIRTELSDVDPQGQKRSISGAVQGVLKF